MSARGRTRRLVEPSTLSEEIRVKDTCFACVTSRWSRDAILRAKKQNENGGVWKFNTQICARVKHENVVPITSLEMMLGPQLG